MSGFNDDHEYDGIPCDAETADWFDAIEGGDMAGPPPKGLGRWIDAGGRFTSDHLGVVRSYIHMQNRDIKHRQKRLDECQKRARAEQKRARALDIDASATRNAANLRRFADDVRAMADRLDAGPSGPSPAAGRPISLVAFVRAVEAVDMGTARRISEAVNAYHRGSGCLPDTLTLGQDAVDAIAPGEGSPRRLGDFTLTLRPDGVWQVGPWEGGS